MSLQFSEEHSAVVAGVVFLGFYGVRSLIGYIHGKPDWANARFKRDEGLPPPPAKIRLTKGEMTNPYICWPTVIVLALSWMGMLVSIYGFMHQMLAWYSSVCLSTISLFVMFTPMHDSVHNSISRSKTINDALGFMAGAGFLIPMPIFRYIHIMHHRYNGCDVLDPDAWAGKGPWYVLPLRWATVIPYYLYYVDTRYEHEKESGKIAPMLQTAKFWERFMRMVGFPLFTCLGYFVGEAIIYCWVLPLLLSTTYLMYIFDYVPHRPHQISDRENPYLATHITRGLMYIQELTLPMMFQNYHLIHHLYPYVPFYGYSKIYWGHFDEFQKHGVKVMPLLKPTPFDDDLFHHEKR